MATAKKGRQKLQLSKKKCKDKWLGSVIIHQQEQLAVVSLSFKILHVAC